MTPPEEPTQQVVVNPPPEPQAPVQVVVNNPPPTAPPADEELDRATLEDIITECLRREVRPLLERMEEASEMAERAADGAQPTNGSGNSSTSGTATVTPAGVSDTVSGGEPAAVVAAAVVPVPPEPIAPQAAPQPEAKPSLLRRILHGQ